MPFDYSKLRGRIREKGKTLSDVAVAAGIAESTLIQKINNHCQFKQREIVSICSFLDIPGDQVCTYFFTL